VITVEQAKLQYVGVDAIHDFDHVLRVLHMAERLGRVEGADIEIVRTAALLHDIARGRGDRMLDDHAHAGAKLARDLLVTQPPHKVEAVVHAIAAHRFRTEPVPQTLEAMVVHDADKLDAIGAIGVARAFAYGGHEGQRLWAEAPTEYVETLASRQEHTPVHEYHHKLRKIRERLYTASARQVAEERHTFMVAYFERLDLEVHGMA
jgi:uncharacterized protein